MVNNDILFKFTWKAFFEIIQGRNNGPDRKGVLKKKIRGNIGAPRGHFGVSRCARPGAGSERVRGCRRGSVMDLCPRLKAFKNAQTSHGAKARMAQNPCF